MSEQLCFNLLQMEETLFMYVYIAFSLGLVENLSLLDPTVPVNASMIAAIPSIPNRSAGVRYTFHTGPEINNC